MDHSWVTTSLLMGYSWFTRGLSMAYCWLTQQESWGPKMARLHERICQCQLISAYCLSFYFSFFFGPLLLEMKLFIFNFPLDSVHGLSTSEPLFTSPPPSTPFPTFIYYTRYVFPTRLNTKSFLSTFFFLKPRHNYSSLSENQAKLLPTISRGSV